MDIADLCTRYPVVYHMATVGSWPGIEQRGLLSTTALLDLFEVEGDRREAIESRKRPESIVITHPQHGSATIRDQKPLHDSVLVRCLRGRVSVEDWHRLLNGLAFFWVDEKRLNDLRNARAYREQRQTVIFLDTRRLVERYAARIRLAHINTGATRSVFHFRDLETFQTIEQYRHRKVVELTIDRGVPDVAEIAVRVEEVGGPETSRVLWPKPS